MNLPLSKEQKVEIVESIRRFVAEEWDQEVSVIRAGFLLDYFLKEIAPLAYNQGGGRCAEVFPARGEGSSGDVF